MLGYTGSREFSRRRRDVAREQPAYATAIEIYSALEQQGVPERARIAEIAKLLGNQYSKQRIAAWIKRPQGNNRLTYLELTKCQQPTAKSQPPR